MYKIEVGQGIRVLYSKSATLFGLLFLALFAQLASAQGPLNYFQNYFVTGDYVVAGVGLYGKGDNPTATINFSGVPCTSGPGLLAGVIPCSAKGAVPADIIAAFLYWETIEPTSLTTPSAIAGTFDGAANTIAGLPLGNPQIDACVVGGGTQSKTSYARVYRADVLRYLVINASANVRTANYAHTIAFTGNTTGTQFLGASMVVVYRLVTPGNPNIVPLRSVVIYDGAFTGVASRSPSLNQTMGGFYQAAPNDNARMTHIVGGGQKGFSETLTVNGSIPQGVPSNPFVGAQGADWDNYTFNYNLPSNASSVQTTVQSTNDCLSWAAIINSTNVQDSDLDGLPDIVETSGLNLNPGVRNDGTTTAPVPATFGTCVQSPATCVNFPAMGANPFQPDIFVQIDWMQSIGLSVPDHVHIPQLAALNMVGSTFKSHGINLHFDVGNNYQTSPASPYIIPAKYALGGNVVPESTVLCQSSQTCGFYPQSADYSVLGWKTGFGAIKDGDPDFLNSAGNPQPLPQLFARNRKDTFHYALFSHAIAATTPLSAPAAGSISGVADLPGGDLMITLGLWRSDTPSFDQTGTLLEQAGTLMHELGHNLGLGHAGWTDTPVCKPDYPSVMNYLYQVQGLTDAAGNEHLDYSYGLELPLAESLLIPNFPLGIQTYRVRYFGPLNSKTNTPGQASAVFCTGNLLTGSEGKYVRLESPSVSTPDWSNGLVAPGKLLGPLDINYDGATNGIFTDSPDWISLNLQQVGARPTGDAVSLDLGRSDLGRSDLGRSDLGRSDLGRSDLGTSALGQDALGDEDYVTYALSGLNPPTNLTGTVITTTPPSGNPNPGGTGVQLSWLPASGVAYDHYNVYLCNASSSAACTPTTLTASAPGGTPTPSSTVFVNDFVDAGTTCPATKVCYNTPYNFFVTGVVVVGSLSNESPGSNTVASQVNHLFVVGNITPQSIVYGTANPVIATNIYGNVSGSLPVSQVTCVYSPSAPRNVVSAPYSIVCSGPATVSGSPTDGVTYNISYLGHSASTLTITPRPITVKAAASTKVYNGTTVSSSIPTITTGTLAYSADIAAFTESYDNQNVGTTHVLTPAGIVNDGNGGSNYTVTFVTINTGVITPSPITASITASIVGNPTKPYDGTTTATLTPANYALSGLAPGENFTVTQTAGTYNSANVATATTVTASLTPGNFTPVGATLASNYTFPTTASGGGKITAAPLTAAIIGNPTKPYDGTTAATLTPANFSLSGLVGTESFTVTTTVGAYNSPNVATAATVTASPTPGNFTPVGATLASNYGLPTTATGPGAITAVTLTAAITGNPTKPYNSTTSATLAPANFSLSHLVGTESFTVTQTAGTYNSPNVGSATTVTASLTASNFAPVGGTLASNYIFPTTASGAGQIVAASTTISVNSVTPSPTDPNVPVTVTITVAPIAPGAGTPTGSVIVNSSPAGVSCTIASFSAPNGSCVLTFAAAGPENITATYTSNSSNFSASGPSTAIGLTVNPPLSLPAAFLPAADQNVVYQPILLASGGVPTAGTGYIWAVTSGALPTGLSLSPAGTVGAITGSPTASPGQYAFGVTVADALGAVASQAYSITVNALPSLAGGTLPNALVGTPYSYTIPVTAGTPPFTNWTCGNCAANLPVGLSFNNGNISGTATGAVTGSINVSVSDAAGGTATAMYSITADMVTSVGFTGPYQLQNWTATASPVGGTTTITPPSGPSTSGQFAYSINLGGGGVPAQTWTFQDSAAATGTVSFNWQYTGFHAYFDVTALLQVFDASNVVTLYNAGPASCCTSPSGGFSVSGTATINVNQGDNFGWIVGGSNFDSNSVLNGTLTITNFSAPLAIPPATFAATGSMNIARSNPTETLLPNGQVLVAGGCSSAGACNPLASAELYNPATGLFTVTGSMGTARYVPNAALLPNGQVLIAGGITNPDPTYVASAELYDPTMGTFSYTGSMSTARGYFTATALQNGQVLVAGGYNGFVQVTTAEIYDPTMGSFSLTGSQTNQQGGPATLLGNGQVLFTGGYTGSSLATSELYNPTTGMFGLTGSMTTGRGGPAAALLADGQVLVVGGTGNSGVLASAELYAPPN